MQKHIEAHNTLRGFASKTLPIASFSIELHLYYYVFKSLQKIEPELLRYKKFRELAATISAYRKFYAFAFPIKILIAAIGIYINEAIIDA